LFVGDVLSNLGQYYTTLKPNREGASPEVESAPTVADVAGKKKR
jgi:hypothetical protein